MTLVGCELAGGGALSLAMDCSDMLLRHPDAVDEAGMAIAAHLLDLAAIGLGGRSEQAVAAHRGGLRMVRLKAVLMILQRRFAEPDFSAQKLAFEAGLSERYVNELLYEAGAGFSMRLNELRLHRRPTCFRVTASAASATWRLNADSTTSPTSIAASAGVSA